MTELTLQKIKGNSYFYSGRLSIGVYLDNKSKSAILVDSGIDKDTAKKVDKLVDSLGYTIGAIINTHSHADHCGGNKFIQDAHPEINIYSTEFERHFIENPFLEPFCFCSGAVPYKELRNKLLEAEPSVISNVIPYNDSIINIGNVQFNIVTLPGHTNGMIGVISPDKVFYCGDAIFGNETLDKHGVLFYTDIEKSKESLEKLRNYNECVYLLYHGGIVKNIESLINEHLSKLEDTEDFIREIIRKSPITLDNLTHEVMNKYGVAQNVIQYTLTQTCIKSYISNLQRKGLVSLIVKEGLLKFIVAE